MTIQKFCLECKSEFRVRNYRRDTAKYCSRKCSDINAKFEAVYHKTCAICSTKFQAIWNQTKHCSDLCFLAGNIDIDDRTECWNWTGYMSNSTDGKCYGIFGHNGNEIAHRRTFKLFKGQFPDHLMIRHQCHNRLCVNPEHLEPGTAQDNMDDNIRDDRLLLGENTSHAKLTNNQAIEIYKSLESSPILAKRYNVHKTTIQGIKNGVHWWGVTGAPRCNKRKSVLYG